ncbi:MAG: UvrD-helicase domain-containing protein [Lachnospiraceae bacterium]|nr:UvrD-helicase domain-containing protein [Lachnospiraceae bacterium]
MQLNNVINVAAAGAGKTYGICSDALQVIESNATNKRILILSYTNRGVDSINAETRKKYGCTLFTDTSNDMVSFFVK